MKIQTAKAIHQ